MSDEKLYTVSEEAIYDLMATAAACAMLSLMSGIRPPMSREDMIEQMKEYIPPYSLAAAIEYTELGRPDDRRLEFMQRDADNAFQNVDLDRAVIMQAAIDDERENG